MERCLCGQLLVPAIANEHHVRPQAAGGKDGPTLWICVSCHVLIHRLAEKLLSNNGQSMLDQLRLLHPTRYVQEKLTELALTVADDMRAKKERASEINLDEEVSIHVKLPRRAMSAVYRAVAGLKDPRTGRKLGLPTYIRTVFLGHLRGRGLLDG